MQEDLQSDKLHSLHLQSVVDKKGKTITTGHDMSKV